MLEYTPGALELKAAAGHPIALDGAPAFPSMLRTLLHYGYRLYKLPERSKHRPVSPKVIQKGSLPALWELNATVLQVETANARRMQHAYTRCGFALPSELLPGSLRASFDYNTDVLAVRAAVDEAALLRSRGVLRAAKIKLPHARASPDRCVPPARLQRPKQDLEAAVVLLVGGRGLGGLLLSTGPRAANTWKGEQTQAALTYRWVKG